HEVDVVKVLGDGQVRNQLEVVADAFSETAVDLIEAAGGEAVLSERGQALAEAAAEEEAEDEAETDTDDAATA
ncbi:MAG: uL15m family ribosomal protein, partial [Halobacteriales archaeon]